MNLSRTLAAFYASGFVRDVIPIYPLYTIMFTEHDVSPFYYSLLFIIWAVTGLIAEVPSGALADRYSRKWIIVFSGVLKSTAFLAWYFEPTFWGFALGFILWGTSSSLRSGAWEALLYETLKSADHESLFMRHYGRIRSFGTLGVMAGELLGGILILHGYDVVLLVSAVVPLLAVMPIMLWIKDVRTPGSEGVSYARLLKEGVSEILSSRLLRYIALLTGTLLVGWGTYDEYAPPYLFERGFELHIVAFLGAAIILSSALGEFFAERFAHLGQQGLLACMVAANVILILSCIVSSWWIPLCLAVYFFTFSMAGIQLQAQLQDNIEGHARSTATSVLGFVDSVGAILWFLVLGAVAEVSLSAATLSTAVICIVMAFAFQLIARRWRIRFT